MWSVRFPAVATFPVVTVGWRPGCPAGLSGHRALRCITRPFG